MMKAQTQQPEEKTPGKSKVDLKALKEWKVMAQQPLHNEGYKYLQKIPLHEISNMETESTETITVTTDDSLNTVIQALLHHKISSVPVIRAGHPMMGGTVSGFVDLLDIATYIAKSFPAGTKMKREESETLHQHLCEVADVPAWSAINCCHKDLTFALHQDHPVTDAVDLFSKGVHRVCLFDDTKHFTGMCSQFDVLKCLAKGFGEGEMKTCGTTSLQNLGYGASRMISGEPFKSVISIEPDATLLMAAQRMAQTGVKALAIVAPSTGHLIGNFSATDLMGAMSLETEETDLPRLISLFFTPLEEFLGKHSPNSLQPEVQLPSSSFSDTCRLMAKKHIHQLWVVPKLDPVTERVPIGVVTLTDINRIVVGGLPTCTHSVAPCAPESAVSA